MLLILFSFLFLLLFLLLKRKGFTTFNLIRIWMKFCMNVPGSMWKISTEPEISTEIEYSKIYKCFFIYLISQHSVQSSKNALCSWKKINTYKLHWLRIVSYNPQEKLDKCDYFYILKIFFICILIL